MSSLKVLITNHELINRAGTELYVYDLAVRLQELGHKPYVYSPFVGTIGNEMKQVTIPVVDSLQDLTITPDIIHGHDHLSMMAALLRFPKTLGIAICHGWLPLEHIPIQFPRIVHYVAVSQACYDRLATHGIREEMISLIYNFVDLERFKLSGSLPQTLKRALFITNVSNEEGIHTLRKACERANITLDIVGLATNNATDKPEELLPQYDLVFAKGKTALEALAVGRAVILCEYGKIGPLITMKNIQELRQLNFGIRCIQQPLNIETVTREINAYDAQDAAAVSSFVRERVDKKAVIDQFVDLYNDQLQQYKAKESQDLNESNHVSKYLEFIAKQQKNSVIYNHSLKFEAIESTLKNHQQILTQFNQKFTLLNKMYESMIRLPLFGKLIKYLMRKYRNI